MDGYWDEGMMYSSKGSAGPRRIQKRGDESAKKSQGC